MITFLGGAGARSARAGDARTGQMAEFAARDLTQPVPPHERRSRVLTQLKLSKGKAERKTRKNILHTAQGRWVSCPVR